MQKLQAFHVCEIGASHIKDGKPCQDFSLSYESRDYAVAIVCDGHGGNKYLRSDRGSRMAAEQTMEAVSELMKNRFRKSLMGMKVMDTLLTYPEKFMSQLAANIIYRWRECVEKDFAGEPFSEKEIAVLTPKELDSFQADDGWVTAYGTTLIVAVMARNFWFGLQIGDGKCVAVSDKGAFSQPIPWDDSCFLNVTTSLCDVQALSRFRNYFSAENLPAAIFVGSDGVDDTFGTDDALHDFYQTVLKLFAEKGMEQAKVELQNYLPTLSTKGSQDDIAIAGITNVKT
ncbi:MAG: protein phosphatase 2C domain-containing protein [Bacteroidetes bacterium]|nr:protein phosphatase 2C domain-containing protein [Bacteroidota bacterium]MCL6102997.1 protein phosphatase 2C domain-containing protein [Bacteroidota bacterium]